jgi:hypothetical protein
MPLDPNLSQINPVHTPTLYLLKNIKTVSPLPLHVNQLFSPPNWVNWITSDADTWLLLSCPRNASLQSVTDIPAKTRYRPNSIQLHPSRQHEEEAWFSLSIIWKSLCRHLKEREQVPIKNMTPYAGPWKGPNSSLPNFLLSSVPPLPAWRLHIAQYRLPLISRLLIHPPPPPSSQPTVPLTQRKSPSTQVQASSL